jgi:hypothetical protein
MHWVEKAIIKDHVGGELKQRGWDVYNYQPTQSDAMNDYCDWCHWCGLATHDDIPGAVIVILAEPINMLVIEKPALMIPGEKPLPLYTSLKKGMTWHIEKDGEIIAQGRVPRNVRHSVHEKANTAVFVDKLERLVGR